MANDIASNQINEEELISDLEGQRSFDKTNWDLIDFGAERPFAAAWEDMAGDDDLASMEDIECFWGHKLSKDEIIDFEKDYPEGGAPYECIFDDC